MGLLTQGKPLNWEETKKHAEHVRVHGIRQFINLYKKLKDRQDPCLKWGDEIEYMIVKFDDVENKCKVSLRAEELLKVMDEREEKEGANREVLWRPEFGSYMIEGTPGGPYGEECDGQGLLSYLSKVESNMALRRKEIEELLHQGESILSITSFPRLGCPYFSEPCYFPNPKTGISGSIFFPDEAIFSGHPRFRTLVQNIRARRNRKVIINLPIFKDVKTSDPFIEVFDDEEAIAAQKADNVYMDAMGFGMGCCCLQVTFQASNLHEAVVLYDQLTPVCPVAMALSASSPIHRGYLTNRDCRWSVISQAVDDRTKEELGEEPSTSSAFRINKSRYDSIDSYISHCSEQYNDIQLVYNESYYETMVAEGVDPVIARHVAHLFIRDPITLYKEKLDQDDENETDHFENIQSTNWQTMRFKPPPPNSPIGWRVEFRPMEVQITDFENAAYVVFIVLLTRVILSYRLNLLIPISKVDENMNEAQKKDAVKRGKFWFRKDIITQVSPPEATHCFQSTGCPFANTDFNNASESNNTDQSCVLMTTNEIINGGLQFPGLVPLLRQYLISLDIDAATHCIIQKYLNLIAGRASGKYVTTATWIRDFVRDHPKYMFDSHVSERINYDLLKVISQITKGDKVVTELF